MDVQVQPLDVLLSWFPISQIFDRFGISYTIDGPQFEYFVYGKKLWPRHFPFANCLP
jgi:hypothetical protein